MSEHQRQTPKQSRFRLPTKNSPVIVGKKTGKSSPVVGALPSPRRASLFKLGSTTPVKNSPIPNRLVKPSSPAVSLSKIADAASSGSMSTKPDRIGAIVYSPRRLKQKVKTVSIIS